MASLVGAARENIVRPLGEFKQPGILQVKGRKIIVIDIVKLIEAANYAR